jgi:hypothetical protein
VKTALQGRTAMFEAVQDEFDAAGLELTPQLIKLIQSILNTCIEQAEASKMQILSAAGTRMLNQFEYDLQELRRIAQEVYDELMLKAKRKALTPSEVETLEMVLLQRLWQDMMILNGRRFRLPAGTVPRLSGVEP